MNILDKAISVLSPGWAAKRVAEREMLATIQHYSEHHEAQRAERSYYESSTPRRGTEAVQMIPSAGDVPFNERQRLRAKTQQILRNSPSAVALIDALVQRMAPRTIRPEPQALDDDGNADAAFRSRAKFLWDEWAGNCDTRGKLSFNDLLQQVARDCASTGDGLFHLRRHSVGSAKRFGLRCPLSLTSLESEQLDELRNQWGPAPEGEPIIFEGVVLDPEFFRPTGYYLRHGNPYHQVSLQDWLSDLYPADDIIHLLYPNPLRPSSIRGYPALSPVLDTFSMINDLCLNELVSSKVASVFSMWIQRNPVSNFNYPRNRALPQDDQDGNRRLFGQPGTVPVLRTGEELRGFNPNRPNSTCDGFCTFLLRQIATAYPVKPSVLTGDFKAASYSSEASAEIENFPRRDALFQYFTSTVCDRIYYEFIAACRLAGLFEGYESGEGSPEDRQLYKANWPEQQIRSINPQNDVQASLSAALSCLSSLKKESQKWGTSLDENVKELGELIQLCEANKVPFEVILRILNVPISPIVIGDDKSSDEDDSEQNSDEAA